MYIVRVGFGKWALKTVFYPIGIKILGIKNYNKCLKKHNLQLLFNTFCCEINNKQKMNLVPVSPFDNKYGRVNQEER